ncbi:MAG: membrane protein insertion efficiency factor YidD [Armatimonadetes bacterium]|nr:membrane protein insertion efficiency factor YidD [Armatimonadota bacterium]
MLRRMAVSPIRLYQRWVSRWLPATCRFHPTCSHYCVAAVERFGLVKGMGLTVMRLARCHPFHPGGLDPVPEQQDKDRDHLIMEF